MFRFSTNLAKGPQTKKTIAVLNQLSGRCGYSYIRTIDFLPVPLSRSTYLVTEVSAGQLNE
jgi:hypothetical protein